MSERVYASIDFLPVCSKCHQIIYAMIDFAHDPLSFDIFDTTTNPSVCVPGAIYPEFCPHCSAPFDTITIPTKLPYDNTLKIRKGI